MFVIVTLLNSKLYNSNNFFPLLIILVGVTITGSCELVVVIPVLVEEGTGTINELDTRSMDKGNNYVNGCMHIPSYLHALLYTLCCAVHISRFHFNSWYNI